MALRKYLAAAIFLLALASAGILAWDPPGGVLGRSANSEQTPQLQRVPVVVELFTSEGCSSCPPADNLLAELEREQPLSNAEIIGLEEHVDYWNNLGWTDPFSSSSWTARQYEYAELLGNQNPYTPQMVVDGTTELVGSRERKARSVISQAAAGKTTQVELSEVAPLQGQTVTLDVHVPQLANATEGDTPEVMLAITESGLQSAVTRGENAGEELHHASVLRELKRLGTAKEKSGPAFSALYNMSLHPGWKRENLRVVAFLQEKKSRRILGAAQIRIVQ